VDEGCKGCGTLDTKNILQAPVRQIPLTNTCRAEFSRAPSLAAM
jgi:hypothetical protein